MKKERSNLPKHSQGLPTALLLGDCKVVRDSRVVPVKVVK